MGLPAPLLCRRLECTTTMRAWNGGISDAAITIDPTVATNALVRVLVIAAHGQQASHRPPRARHRGRASALALSRHRRQASYGRHHYRLGLHRRRSAGWWTGPDVRRHPPYRHERWEVTSTGGAAGYSRFWYIR